MWRGQERSAARPEITAVQPALQQREQRSNDGDG